jgi:hypothetical protein
MLLGKKMDSILRSRFEDFSTGRAINTKLVIISLDISEVN